MKYAHHCTARLKFERTPANHDFPHTTKVPPGEQDAFVDEWRKEAKSTIKEEGNRCEVEEEDIRIAAAFFNLCAACADLMHPPRSLYIRKFFKSKFSLNT